MPPMSGKIEDGLFLDIFGVYRIIQANSMIHGPYVDGLQPIAPYFGRNHHPLTSYSTLWLGGS